MVWTKVREKWDARMAFLVSWLAAPYIIFTLYATQLPHYVMPGFPAAMVLLMVCGMDLEKPSEPQYLWSILTKLVLLFPLAAMALPLCRIDGADRFFWAYMLFIAGLNGVSSLASYSLQQLRTIPGRIIWILFVLFAFGFMAAVGWAVVRIFNIHFRPGAIPQRPVWEWCLMAVVLFTCTAIAGLFMLKMQKRRPSRRLKLTCGMRVFGALMGLALFVPGLAMISTELRKVHPAAQLATQAGLLPDKVELLGWEFNEPSLTFYFNHPWKFPNKLDTVVDHMNHKGPRVVVLLRREWTVSRTMKDTFAGKPGFSTDSDFSKEVDAVIAAHPDYRVTSFDGLNAARGSWAELRMLVRK